MTVRLVNHFTLGFGRELPSSRPKDYVVDRRDARVAAPSDLYMLATIRGVLAERWGATEVRDDLGLYLAGSKKLTGGLLQEAWRKESDSYDVIGALRDPAREEQMVTLVQTSIHPFFTISALPNLDMYLAAKSFGVGGPIDHFISEPWSDVAAVLVAYEAVRTGEVAEAVVGSVSLDPQTDSSAVLDREAGPTVPTPGPHEGGIALRLAQAGQSNDACIRAPLLSVGAARKQREEQVHKWLAAGPPPSRIVVLSDEPLVHVLSDELPGTVVQAKPLPPHGTPALATLVEEVRGDESLCVLASYGDAVAGIGTLAGDRP